MRHAIEDKTRLLQRVRRLRGQVEAIERAFRCTSCCSKPLDLT